MYSPVFWRVVPGLAVVEHDTPGGQVDDFGFGYIDTIFDVE